MLRAQNLQKSFGDLAVISDLSLQLKEGEIIAILGASGCGKTTLLKLLLGSETADSGTIESSLKRPGPQIGYQAQANQLLPWRTVCSNVALGPELLGTDKSRARDKARQLLQQVGLNSLENSYPHDLSGGMLQRALLARTLALEPKLLLLDEPMSNLDIIARQDLGKAIRDYVKENNAAALIVTHSVEEACQIADHVMIISQKPATILHEITITDAVANMPRVQQALVDSIRSAA